MGNERPGLSPADRQLVWQLFAAVGAGAAVGLIVGGIGGRIAMLLLRLGSTDTLHGVPTDDGFEIGRISTSTGFLLMVTAGLGAAAGVAYLVARSTMPRRGRALAFGIAAALVTGADTVKTDGIDFTLLDPKPFAIASFVLLPGIAALAIGLLVDRLLEVEPFSRRRLTVALGLAWVPLLAGAVIFLGVTAAALGLRRLPVLSSAALRAGRIVVPLVLVAASIRAGIELWRDTAEIL